mmetsp:Transcript_17888/g.28937  ORF Transcript_17888/g.28937 Transcript_17888/m.28937 type:complete len:205 (-) Transcript_17888:803-1417(-)
MANPSAADPTTSTAPVPTESGGVVDMDGKGDGERQQGLREQRGSQCATTTTTADATTSGRLRRSDILQGDRPHLRAGRAGRTVRSRVAIVHRHGHAGGVRQPHHRRGGLRAQGGRELFLSDEAKYDCRRDVMQQVADELADVGLSHDAIPILYHLTSIYDHSVFEAFSRVVQRLIPELPNLEHLLNVLVSSCSMEKAYLFDVAS